MFFNVKDIEQFLAQKEFIDTVVVPLVSLDFTEDKIKQSGSSVDFLMSLTSFIEQQFKGRLMVLPPYTYLSDAKNEDYPNVLTEQLHKIGFKHVFHITSDSFWTSFKDELNIIWLPSIPLESMDKNVKNSILEDQLRQIIPIFSAKWS